MTPSILILSAAVIALVAFTTSLATAIALRLARSKIRAVAPAAQARLYLAAAVAPAFVAAIAIVAVFAPSLGWIADHCGIAPSVHAHPHVCTIHPVVDLPAVTLIAVGGFLAARLAFAVVAQLRAWGRAQLRLRALVRQSSAGERGARVLPIGEPQAFVLGLVRPTLFVTEGLASGAGRDHLDAVLAHERAHIDRRDPLRRYLANFGLAFHLPLIAGEISAALGEAQELAADHRAAREVGARRVAHALVALSRSSARVPRHAFGFSVTDLETRVMALLETGPRPDQPRRRTVAIAALLAVVAVAATAESVHHGLESLLGALGA